MSAKRSTLTVPEAAIALGVHRLTLYRLIREGRSPVPYLQVGRRIVIPRLALDRVLAGEAAPEASSS